MKEANSESDLPKLTKVCSIGVETTSQMIKEIKKKLCDSRLYGKDTVGEVDKLQPSNSFFTYVGNLLKSFSKNLSQDKLLEKFYGNVYDNWKVYFPTAKDGKYVFLVLIHLPEKLVRYYKERNLDGEPEVCCNLDILTSANKIVRKLITVLPYVTKI